MTPNKVALAVVFTVVVGTLTTISIHSAWREDEIQRAMAVQAADQAEQQRQRDAEARVYEAELRADEARAAQQAAENMARAPRLLASDVQAIDCGGFFSSCTRARCTVLNTGGSSGSSDVNISVTPSDGSGTVTETVAALVEAGGRQIISHDFDGVPAGGARVECVAL